MSETNDRRGFPEGYTFRKGDWLCPSAGCEGYVSSSGSHYCIRCGRLQPHSIIIDQIANDPTFRCSPCRLTGCPGRLCADAHAASEIRSAKSARKLKQVASGWMTPIVPTPSSEEIRDFCQRWGLGKMGLEILSKQRPSVGDALLRYFVVENTQLNDDAIQKQFKDLAAFYARPQMLFLSTPSELFESIKKIMAIREAPLGLACSAEGHLAVALDSEVHLFQLASMAAPEAALLLFAIVANGVSVVQTNEDIIRIKQASPEEWRTLSARIRIVSNPTDIESNESDPYTALADRALQAKTDAMTQSKYNLLT